MPSPNRSPLALQPLSLDNQQPHQRLRNQLYNILPLPRHAIFHVCLQIHSLFNVPLIRGEFGVKWKFQNVHAVSPSADYHSTNKSASGILARARTLKQDSLNAIKKDKGKAKEVEDDEKVEDSVRENENEEEDEYDDSDGSDTEEGTISSSDKLDANSSSRSACSGSRSRSGNQSSSSSLPSPVSSHLPTETLSPPKLPSGRATPDMPKPGAGLPAIPRGRTKFLELQRHNVKWEKTVNVAVHMTVQKETFDILPCELKLFVMQRVIPGDVDSPSKPRLGAIYLNLAEYVNKGPVSRRYLLQDCKFNATLQLTIELFHIGGEKNFVPPPLHRSEIMAGVESILKRDSNEYLKKSHWFHTSYLRPPENDSPVDPKDQEEKKSEFDSFVPVLPPEMLTSLRTTDNIIEAIFNPVPTSSSAPSPFTYYDPEILRPRINISVEPDSNADEDNDIDENNNKDTPDAKSTPNGRKHHKRWWKKIGPNRRDSAQSVQSTTSSSSQVSSGNQRVSDRDNVVYREPESVSTSAIKPLDNSSRSTKSL